MYVPIPVCPVRPPIERTRLYVIGQICSTQRHPHSLVQTPFDRRNKLRSTMTMSRRNAFQMTRHIFLRCLSHNTWYHPNSRVPLQSIQRNMGHKRDAIRDARRWSPHRSHASQVINLGKKMLKDQKQKVINVRRTFHQKFHAMCRLMSPEDSFEFRMRSRELFHRDGAFDDKYCECVKKGVAYRYFYMYPEFQFEKEFKEFVLLDDRYTVKWGRYDPKIFGAKIVFVPKEPMHHMLPGNWNEEYDEGEISEDEED